MVSGGHRPSISDFVSMNVNTPYMASCNVSAPYVPDEMRGQDSNLGSISAYWLRRLFHLDQLTLPQLELPWVEAHRYIAASTPYACHSSRCFRGWNHGALVGHDIQIRSIH